MTVQIIRGNALDLPLEDNSVDLVCTSPPYFGLRSYSDGGVHYDGQLGSEATPAEFVDALIAATREMVRVTKPSGSIFVNLGDKYDSGTTASRTNPGTIKDGTGQGYYLGSPRVSFGRAKSLMGMPWRYALRCIDDLGLILRAEIIWAKPNGLPESVTDRVRRSHEQWFHFTLQPRYYSAVDTIREEHVEAQRGGVLTWQQRKDRDDKAARYSDQNGHGGTAGMAQSPLGKLPGSVWTIPTQPLTVPASLGVDHFAAFPMEWPRRIIRGWSPSGVCTVCGQGRRPVVTKELGPPTWQRVNNNNGPRTARRLSEKDRDSGLMAYEPEVRGSFYGGVTGESCGCETPTAPTRPSVVLDPFGGTGTTALVAHALGRHGISVDMSADYCRLAEWRCNDPAQLAAALQVDKPEPVAPDQLDLFGEEAS